MAVRYIALDPHGGVHVAPDGESVFTHCIVVRRRYAIALEKARQIPPVTRRRYDILSSMAAGSLDHLAAGSWRSRIGDREYSRLRKRASALLLGAQSYQEYAQKLVIENIRLTERRKNEGYFDQWSAVLWASSLEEAEQEGTAMALEEDFRDVAIVDVVPE